MLCQKLVDLERFRTANSAYLISDTRTALLHTKVLCSDGFSRTSQRKSLDKQKSSVHSDGKIHEAALKLSWAVDYAMLW